MSRQLGLDTIHLRPTARLAHTEYCSDAALVRAVTQQTGLPFHDAWEFDLHWVTWEGKAGLGHQGRVTDMGHAEFLEGGVDLRQPKPSPFTEVQQVLEFDAVKEYGLQPFDQLVADLEEYYQTNQKAHPNQIWTGGYYNTIVSGAIQAFGWDMLLEAAAYRQEFARVLDSIFRLSLHGYQAWAKTSIEVFISHDDMVWSSGGFMHPWFYKEVIFPRFAQLWKPLKDAGKKVLFCSDGNWIDFVDDIAAAGADGFIFEPMMPLEPVVKKYGRTHVIASSKVDCRTMAFGTREEVRRQIDQTLELAFDCPGFMFAVGNHIPSNVPVEMGLFYFDYLRKHWWR